MASLHERKNKDGSISYRVQIRLKGYPNRSYTFPCKFEAEIAKKEFDRLVLLGEVHLLPCPVQLHRRCRDFRSKILKEPLNDFFSLPASIQKEVVQFYREYFFETIKHLIPSQGEIKPTEVDGYQT